MVTRIIILRRRRPRITNLSNKFPSHNRSSRLFRFNPRSSRVTLNTNRIKTRNYIEALKMFSSSRNGNNLSFLCRSNHYSAGASQSQKKRLLAKAQSECMLNSSNNSSSSNNTAAISSSHCSNNSSSNSSSSSTGNAQNNSVTGHAADSTHNHCQQLLPAKQEPGVCDIQHHPCQGYISAQDQIVYSRLAFSDMYFLRLLFFKNNKRLCCPAATRGTLGRVISRVLIAS